MEWQQGVSAEEASAMAMPKRQRRPSVRLGEIGDQPAAIIAAEAYWRRLSLWKSQQQESIHHHLHHRHPTNPTDSPSRASSNGTSRALPSGTRALSTGPSRDPPSTARALTSTNTRNLHSATRDLPSGTSRAIPGTTRALPSGYQEHISGSDLDELATVSPPPSSTIEKPPPPSSTFQAKKSHSIMSKRVRNSKQFRQKRRRVLASSVKPSPTPSPPNPPPPEPFLFTEENKEEGDEEVEEEEEEEGGRVDPPPPSMYPLLEEACLETSEEHKFSKEAPLPPPQPGLLCVNNFQMYEYPQIGTPEQEKSEDDQVGSANEQEGFELNPIGGVQTRPSLNTHIGFQQKRLEVNTRPIITTDTQNINGNPEEEEEEEDQEPLSNNSDEHLQTIQSKLTNGIRGWLHGLGLEKYSPVFDAHEVDTDVLPLLTLEDLKEMGINAVGPRRKMFFAIQQLAKALLISSAESY